MENSLEGKVNRLLTNRRFFEVLVRAVGHKSYPDSGDPVAVAKQFAFGYHCPCFEFVVIDVPDLDFWVQCIRHLKVVRTQMSTPQSFGHFGLNAPADERLYRVIITSGKYVCRLGENNSQGRAVAFGVDHLRVRSEMQFFWDQNIRMWLRARVANLIV